MSFGENELLEIGNSLDDDEISLFIEGNQNVHTTKKTKTDLNVSMLMIFAVINLLLRDFVCSVERDFDSSLVF